MKDKKEIRKPEQAAEEIPEEDLNEVSGGYLRKVNPSVNPKDKNNQGKNK